MIRFFGCQKEHSCFMGANKNINKWDLGIDSKLHGKL
jgi:hypothetical protein